MSARMIATILCLAAIPVAKGEVVVELVPDRPGPYTTGRRVTVDVWLHSEVSFGLRLKTVQFDFTDTDPAFSLDSTFAFDFSSLGDQPNYYLGAHHPELPVPWTTNGVECICPSYFLLLPGQGSLHIGRIGVRPPATPGVYRLEVMNADEPDRFMGARLLGLGSSIEWRAFTGELTGGALDFVVEEPPIPTLSQWGMIAMGCLLLVFGARMIVRRTQPEQTGGERSCQHLHNRALLKPSR